MVQQALAEGRPYSMAFVDMRMPPGWDGLKTIEHLWAADADVQVVICSAHTDYDWTEVVAETRSFRQIIGAAQTRRADRGPAMRHGPEPQMGK